MKKVTFSLLIALVALSFSHPTSFQYYASFKGKKQGQLKAESLKGGRAKDGWIEIASFSFGAANTGVADAKSGKGGGQGKVAPIVITKEKDEVSPKLLDAQVNSETFETIVVQTVDHPKTGGEKVVETVTLTNAQIIEYKTNSGLETISFTYDQIMRKK